MIKYFTLIIFISVLKLYKSGVHSENNNQDVSDHTFNVSLDDQNKYHMYWSYDQNSVTIRVEALLATSVDWFAIGFSDEGDINGSDMCILWTDTEFKFNLLVNYVKMNIV